MYVFLSSVANLEARSTSLPSKFNINVVGIIYTINAFLPLLKAGALKKVVALTSALGDLDFTRQVEFPLFAPNSISKAALNMAVAKFAMKYKAEGLVFLSICPGMVNTRVTPRESCRFWPAC